MSKSLAEQIAELDEDQRAAALAELPESVLSNLQESWEFWGRPEQFEPKVDYPFYIFMLCAGRGMGKTRSASEWVHDRVNKGSARRIHLVSRTAADYRDTLVEGDSGILETQKSANKVTWSPSKRKLEWENGAQALCFSAEEPDALRGPQCDTAVAEELATWKMIPDSSGSTAWANLLFGLRLGSDPKVCVATTPKPTPIIKELVQKAADHKDVALQRGSTYDNLANLAPTFVNEIISRYIGTRLGGQEIYGLLLTAAENALWREDDLNQYRVSNASDLPELSSLAVAVDPSVSERGEGDECGIVVGGISRHSLPTYINGLLLYVRHMYVLDDASLSAGPEAWGQRVVDVARRFGTNRVVAEVNQGGAMVKTVIGNIDPNLKVDMVRAVESKRARAEPIAQLSEQGRYHHYGYLPELESELISWEPGPGNRSPDRLDAVVWLGHHLLPELQSAAAEFESVAGQSIDPALRGEGGGGAWSGQIEVYATQLPGR